MPSRSRLNDGRKLPKGADQSPDEYAQTDLLDGQPIPERDNLYLRTRSLHGSMQVSSNPLSIRFTW